MRQRVAAMMVAALQDAEAARATAQPPSQASLARQACRIAPLHNHKTSTPPAAPPRKSYP
jgi:hypothetical protein